MPAPATRPMLTGLGAADLSINCLRPARRTVTGTHLAPGRAIEPGNHITHARPRRVAASTPVIRLLRPLDDGEQEPRSRPQVTAAGSIAWRAGARGKPCPSQ